jgi:hypothetical protein
MSLRRRVQRISLGLLLLSGPALAAGPGALHPRSLPRIAPRSVPSGYGTTQTSSLDVPEWEFGPATSETLFLDLGIFTPNLGRFSSGGASDTFIAPVHLPGGALIQSIELDACDTSATTDHVTATLGYADRLDGLAHAIGDVLVSSADAVEPCKAYVQDVSAVGYAVDSTGGRLFLIIETEAGDATTSFTGMKVGYKLQVSPAPRAASFDDVPTTHEFFQYVEALYQSGITVGCGDGNFCPDEPLTRGQMAVFLAKALGLYYP